MEEARQFEKVRLAGAASLHRLRFAGGSVECSVAEEQGEPDWFALPLMHNLHCHADRAFSAGGSRARSLQEAIELAGKARSSFTVEDVHARAARFLARALSHGTGRLRTHTDVDPVVDFRSMEGVRRAVSDFSGLVDVDVIAFATARNDLVEEVARDRLRQAVAMGADYIGAVPAMSAHPDRAVEAALDMALELDLPLDAHLDEHMDGTASLALRLADAALERGLAGRVTLSHGCATSMLEPAVLSRLAVRLAEAGITLVSLPETNLYLQDRREGTPRRRGVAMIREFMAAGVPVRLGSDNVRDWFYPFGDADMLETAFVAALAGHLDGEAELLACLCGGETGLQPEALSDLVLIPAQSFDDALARRPQGRVVVREGLIVSG